MQFKQYVSDAIVTESVLTGSIQVDQARFTNVLRAFVAAGNLLDVMKKDIFYGLPTNADKLTARSNRLSQNEWELEEATLDILDGIVVPETELTGVDTRLAHAIIGISTESVELCEALIKSITTNTSIDMVNVLEEMFDCMWYILIAHDAANADVSQTLDRGFAKLKARYADKFDKARAHERDLVTERAILEGSSPE